VQRQRTRSNRSRWKTKLVVSILITITLVIGVGVWSTHNYIWRLPSRPSSQLRALVMDQLSLNYPDPSFVTNVTNDLQGAGYAVDYSGPSPTAIDSFRHIPEQGYDLIIIRAHEGSSQAIITTESYSRSEYLTDQLSGRLVPAQVGTGPTFFALTPKFVREEMVGSFPGSTIIVMGCAALQGSQDMAAAFLDKGANFFVGWDGLVSIIHTDSATVRLVELLGAGKSVRDAAGMAGGADPVYGAKLGYLDWDTLAQSRANRLFSEVIVSSAIASILLVGPLAVFSAPRLLDLFEHFRELISRRRTQPDKGSLTNEQTA
jgi:hypothetical protein